ISGLFRCSTRTRGTLSCPLVTRHAPLPSPFVWRIIVPESCVSLLRLLVDFMLGAPLVVCPRALTAWLLAHHDIVMQSTPEQAMSGLLFIILIPGILFGLVDSCCDNGTFSSANQVCQVPGSVRSRCRGQGGISERYSSGRQVRVMRQNILFIRTQCFSRSSHRCKGSGWMANY